MQIIPSLIIASLALSTAYGEWGETPLGAPVEVKDPGPAAIKRKIETRYRSTPVDAPPLELIREGKAAALIIIPASPGNAEQRAANLLRETLTAMGAAGFEIVPEYSVVIAEDGTLLDAKKRPWPAGIWIGKTQRAAMEKLSADDLRIEGFRRVRRGNHLFLLGNDEAKLPANGTYFCAIDLAERHFGVRWLWPGESGTVIPRRSSLSLPALDEQDEPALPQRVIRNGALSDRSRAGLNLLEQPDSSYSAVIALNGQWLAHQKTGSTFDLQYRHAYGDWYEKYGETHPDWFALRPDNTRRQVSERPRLCKSNPAVAHQAALQVLAKYAENPDLDSASISPNDGSGTDGFCMCTECRKLDPANGRPVQLLKMVGKERQSFSYPSLSDRVVTFYNRIAEEVVKKNPKARMGAYAYSAYRDVPLGVTLHPSIILGFVGLDYTDESLRKSDLERWNGWSHRAGDLLLRPNALHGGNALPLLYPHRLAEDVRHCYATGMIAADFDSLTSHWSTQGLNYYILAKLLWDPSVEIDAAIRDYCEAGFGPAAGKIGRYFALIEAKSAEMAGSGRQAVEAQLREEEDDTAQTNARLRHRRAFELAYFKAFSPEVMQQLRTLLSEAEAEAKGDAAILHRIAFLRRGLDYSDHYRALLDENYSVASLKSMLGWYRQTFTEEPLSINAPTRLWRTGALYRKIK